MNLYKEGCTLVGQNRGCSSVPIQFQSLKRNAESDALQDNKGFLTANEPRAILSYNNAIRRVW